MDPEHLEAQRMIERLYGDYGPVVVERIKKHPQCVRFGQFHRKKIKHFLFV